MLKESVLNRLYIPLLWELALVIATIVVPKQAFNLFFVFYLGLLVYFYFIHKQFSFRKMRSHFGKIKEFWLPVLITFGGLFAAGKLREFITMTYSYDIDDHVVNIIVENDLIPTLVYAFMMIVMKPVAEEFFYRRALISFDNKKKTAILTVVSLLLCSIARAHGWLGIAEWMIMALPVTIAYLSTKNVYVTVMAHVLFELYDNAYEVVYTVGRILYR